MLPPAPWFQMRFSIYDGFNHSSSTLYWSITGGSVLTQTNHDNITTTLVGVFRPLLVALLSQHAYITEFYTRSLLGTTDLEGYYSPPIEDATGAISGDCMPTESVLEIQRRTGHVGRSNRGRIFISGISEAANNDGLLIAGPTKTALGNLASAIGSNQTSTAFTLAARHWNRLTNTLMPVTVARGMDAFMSRRDRRRNVRPRPF